jgi:hypothetical protein
MKSGTNVRTILYYLWTMYRKMSSSETESLSGSEQFMLISGGIAAAGACLGMILQFVLRSRCTTIKCCGIMCERSVLDLEAIDLEIGTHSAQ